MDMNKKTYMQPMAHTTEIDTLAICNQSDPGYAKSTEIEIDNDGWATPRGWEE